MLLQVNDVFELAGVVWYVRKITKKDVIIRRIRRDQIDRIKEKT